MEQQLFMAANSGINFAKYEEIPVDVSPADAPPAIQHFVDAKLHSFVQDNVAKSGYTNPTPVQVFKSRELGIWMLDSEESFFHIWGWRLKMAKSWRALTWSNNL